MTGARLQLVVAHPDDETFGCGSLLLHAAAAGFSTAVLCATRGDAGQAPAGSGLGPAELADVREAELRQAADLLGVARVDVLGFGDSGMNGAAAGSTLVGAPFERVVEEVTAQVADFRPDVLVTLDASDGHRDHARIRDAAVEAARAVGVPRVYLHCLPRALMARWAAQMVLDRPGTEHLAAGVAALGTPEEDVTTVLDTTGFLAVREAALKVHASQESPFDRLPDDLRRAFLTAEHLRRLVPAFDGGPLETQLLP